jgi:hypothetical protein
MSILDKLNRGDSIESKWTILENDWVKLGLLRMNPNEFRAG